MIVDEPASETMVNLNKKIGSPAVVAEIARGNV